MDVKNARGRTVSLLNDDLPRLNNLAPLPPRRPSLQPLPSISSLESYSPSYRHHSTTAAPTRLSTSSSTSSSTTSTRHHSFYTTRPSSDFRRDASTSSSRSNSSLDLPPLRATPLLERSDSSDSRTAPPHSPLTPPATLFGEAALRRSVTATEITKSRRDYSFDSSSAPRLHSKPNAPSRTSSSSDAMDSNGWPGALNGFNDGFYSLPPTTAAGPGPYASNPYAKLPVMTQAPQPSQLLYNSPPQMQQPFAALTQPPPPQAMNGITAGPNQQILQQPHVNTGKSTRKTTYPCPVAKEYNCNESFTTSGHAARHAKKHTGKKDAICPECGKAFTRKDNMEQHRRTHSSGRNTGSQSKPSSRDSEEAKARSKARLQQRKNRPGSISTNVSSHSPMSADALTAPLGASPDLGNVVDPALASPPSLGMSLIPTTQEELLLQQQLAANAVSSGLMHQQPLPALQPLMALDHGMSQSPPGGLGITGHGEENNMPRLETLALAAATQH